MADPQTLMTLLPAEVTAGGRRPPPPCSTGTLSPSESAAAAVVVGFALRSPLALLPPDGKDVGSAIGRTVYDVGE